MGVSINCNRISNMHIFLLGLSIAGFLSLYSRVTFIKQFNLGTTWHTKKQAILDLPKEYAVISQDLNPVLELLPIDEHSNLFKKFILTQSHAYNGQNKAGIFNSVSHQYMPFTQYKSRIEKTIKKINRLAKKNHKKNMLSNKTQSNLNELIDQYKHVINAIAITEEYRQEMLHLSGNKKFDFTSIFKIGFGVIKLI